MVTHVLKRCVRVVAAFDIFAIILASIAFTLLVAITEGQGQAILGYILLWLFLNYPLYMCPQMLLWSTEEVETNYWRAVRYAMPWVVFNFTLCAFAVCRYILLTQLDPAIHLREFTKFTKLDYCIIAFLLIRIPSVLIVLVYFCKPRPRGETLATCGDPERRRDPVGRRLLQRQEDFTQAREMDLNPQLLLAPSPRAGFHRVGSFLGLSMSSRRMSFDSEASLPPAYSFSDLYEATHQPSAVREDKVETPPPTYFDACVSQPQTPVKKSDTIC